MSDDRIIDFNELKNKVKDSEGNNIDLTAKLFNESAPKYEGRVGGYTRILKTGPRRGDNAEVVSDAEVVSGAEAVEDADSDIN